MNYSIIDVSNPIISFSLNNTKKFDLALKLTNTTNYWSIFQYSNTPSLPVSLSNANSTLLNDYVENPIGYADVYQKNTLWRYIIQPPPEYNSSVTSIEMTTISAGCLNCKSIVRDYEYAVQQYYSDSGSFDQNLNMTLKLKNSKTGDVIINIPAKISLENWGVYTNVAIADKDSHYNIYMFVDADSDYYWLPLICLLMVILIVIGQKWIWAYCEKKQRGITDVSIEDLEAKFLKVDINNNVNSGNVNRKPQTERLFCLDTFRGLTMFQMVFVNYRGGNYDIFNHSVWNGITFADVVFPSFMWIMGVSTAFSLKKAHTLIKKDLLFKIIKRTIILFCLGIIVNQGWDLGHLRIMGVLQRFALSYIFVSCLAAFLPIHKSITPFKTANFAIRVGIAQVLPILNLVANKYIPYSSTCPTGYLLPAGLSEFDTSLSDCTGGINKLIDDSVFGINHIYDSPTCKPIYQTGPYDPEGLLGSLNSIFQTFMGLIIGDYFIAVQEKGKRVFFQIGTGGLMILQGFGLAGFQIDGGFLPINKNMWSVSFIFLTGGIANIVMCVIFVLEKVNWWSGWPFGYLGMNGILVYVGSEIMTNKFPFGFWTDGKHFLTLCSSLLGVVLWTLVAYFCYRIKFFIKI